MSRPIVVGRPTEFSAFLSTHADQILSFIPPFLLLPPLPFPSSIPPLYTPSPSSTPISLITSPHPLSPSPLLPFFFEKDSFPSRDGMQ